MAIFNWLWAHPLNPLHPAMLRPPKRPLPPIFSPKFKIVWGGREKVASFTWHWKCPNNFDLHSKSTFRTFGATIKIKLLWQYL